MAMALAARERVISCGKSVMTAASGLPASLDAEYDRPFEVALRWGLVVCVGSPIITILEPSAGRESRALAW